MPSLPRWCRRWWRWQRQIRFDVSVGSAGNLELWTIIRVHGHLALSAAKARLSEIADEVDRTHQRVQITKNGRSYVVLISAEDLASLEATLELLSDPDAMGRVRQAQSDIDNGNFTTGEEVERVMRARGRAGPFD